MLNYAGSNAENPEPQQEDIISVTYNSTMKESALLFINEEMYAGSHYTMNVNEFNLKVFKTYHFSKESDTQRQRRMFFCM